MKINISGDHESCIYHVHTHCSESSIIEVNPLMHLAVVTEGAVMSPIVRDQSCQPVLVDLSIVREDVIKELNKNGKTIVQNIDMQRAISDH